MTFELTDISRSFAERKVLDSVSLRLHAGKICALVGENGAGKSTLVNVACGLVTPSSGTIRVRSKDVTGWSAGEAVAQGVGVVHQHWVLVETMTVSENVVLGREPRTGPLGLFYDRAEADRRVKALAEKYGFSVNPQAKVADLSVGERQRVELLRVLDTGANVLLFDEPTAVLSPMEVQSLLKLLRSLADAGAAVLLISHKLDEVFAIADDIVVLRRGKVVLHQPCSELKPDEVANAMVGGELASVSAQPQVGLDRSKAAAITVEKLVCKAVKSLSFSIQPGEILGIAGVEGNGQADLLAALAGVENIHSGTVKIGDTVVSTDTSVAQRRLAGLGFVPEDREGAGLCAALSIAENLALGTIEMLGGEALLKQAPLEKYAAQVIEKFDIRPPNPRELVHNLSGGNAQKVLVARELQRPNLVALLLAQPTRGVDIGAALTIHHRVLEAKNNGLAILLVSSSLDELRTLSDRIAVMRDGQFVAEFAVKDASDEKLGPWMVGAEAQ